MELLVWQRPDLYKVLTQNELNSGMILIRKAWVDLATHHNDCSQVKTIIL